MFITGAVLATTLATAMVSPNLETPSYTVVEVIRQSKFAGRYGQRVQETIVLESGSQRFRVSVDGAYHTHFAREKDTLKRGDRIQLSGHSNPTDGRIRRDDIRRVR